MKRRLAPQAQSRAGIFLGSNSPLGWIWAIAIAGTTCRMRQASVYRLCVFKPFERISLHVLVHAVIPLEDQAVERIFACVVGPIRLTPATWAPR